MKTGLKIVSILFIICGLVTIFLGLLVVFGINSDFIDMKNTYTEDTLMISGLISLIIGGLQIAVGMCGFSGADGHRSSLNVGIFISVFSVIVSIVNIMKTFAMGTITSNSLIQYGVQTLLPIFYLLLAGNLKTQFARAALEAKIKLKAERKKESENQ